MRILICCILIGQKIDHFDILNNLPIFLKVWELLSRSKFLFQSEVEKAVKEEYKINQQLNRAVAETLKQEINEPQAQANILPVSNLICSDLNNFCPSKTNSTYNVDKQN